jgi:hypothetical protein
MVADEGDGKCEEELGWFVCKMKFLDLDFDLKMKRKKYDVCGTELGLYRCPPPLP